MKRKGSRLKIDYNSPFILSFCLLAMLAFATSTLTGGWVSMHVVSLPGHASLSDWSTYPRLILHVLGHATIDHLFMNMMFILMIGPLLEKAYGAGFLIILSVVTAIATGTIMLLFFDGHLMGASGIVFAFILLSSFTNSKTGTIPLTFILVSLLFLGNEVFSSFEQTEENIARFAHITGGFIGGIAGFFLANRSESAWH